MKVVDQPAIFPSQCALSGRGSGEEGFLDLQKEAPSMIEGRLYVYVPLVMQMGMAVGMVRGEDHDKVADENAGLRARNEQLEKQLEHLEKMRDALETLEDFFPKQVAAIQTEGELDGSDD